jgi:CheY-like chemotaxis protein
MVAIRPTVTIPGRWWRCKELANPSPSTCIRPFIIALSGYAQEEDKKRSADSGIDLHLSKPVDFDPLTSTLRIVREDPRWA